MSEQRRPASDGSELGGGTPVRTKIACALLALIVILGVWLWYENRGEPGPCDQRSTVQACAEYRRLGEIGKR